MHWHTCKSLLNTLGRAVGTCTHNFSAHYPPLYPIPITLMTTIIIACYRLSPAQHRRSTAHNEYNHKLTKEITNQSLRDKTINNNNKKFRSLLALQGSGKNLCGQKPCGIKRPQREKPKLKSATYCIQAEIPVQA